MNRIIILILILLIILLLTYSVEKYGSTPNGEPCSSYTECQNGYCNADPVTGNLVCTGPCDIETGKPSGCSCTGNYNCDQAAGLYCGLTNDAFRYCRPLVEINGACTTDTDCQSGLKCVGLPGTQATCKTPSQITACQSCWSCSSAGEEEQLLVPCEQNCVRTYNC